MVGFNEKSMDSAERFEDEASGVSQIGENTKKDLIVRQAEADGVGGVMRNGEGANSNVPDCKFCAVGKKLVGNMDPFSFERFGGERVAIAGDAILGGENAEARGMIGMFVREE